MYESLYASFYDLYKVLPKRSRCVSYHHWNWFVDLPILAATFNGHCWGHNICFFCGTEDISFALASIGFPWRLQCSLARSSIADVPIAWIGDIEDPIRVDFLYCSC